MARRTAETSAPHQPAGAAPAFDLASEHPLRVLVAEDSHVNQIVLRAHLERVGYHPDLVGDGAEAIEAVLRQPYDLVLVDSHMPGVDGITATREILARLAPERRPAIVSLSADLGEADQRAAREAGMVAHLAKPLVAERLVEVLRSVRPLVGDSRAHVKPSAGPTEEAVTRVDLELLGGYDEGQQAQLAQLFLAEARENLTEIVAAAARDDGAAFAQAAHRFLSATLIVGVPPLSEHLRHAESAARAGASDLGDLAEQAAELFAAVEREFEQRLRA